MTNSKSNQYNLKQGMFVIANDQGTAKGEMTIHTSENTTQKDLLSVLEKLLDAVQKDKVISDSTKSELAIRTEDMISDLQEDDLSEKRVGRFRSFLEQRAPELQLSATLFGMVSAVKDGLDLYFQI
ncbi:hypothetical protein [Risungbinella massiliensis]|uniref:hypothetical protein n=1 Tax=Risungbinella massiliensis TaxID=1329796 RepID=UPI0005CBC8D1|nr:hypothetical protein [Risungbinella massiliensis]